MYKMRLKTYFIYLLSQLTTINILIFVNQKLITKQNSNMKKLLTLLSFIAVLLWASKPPTTAELNND